MNPKTGVSFSRRAFSAPAVLAICLLMVGGAVNVFAQQGFPSALERKLWKELLPWGQNLDANGNEIWGDSNFEPWGDPKRINNKPALNRVETGDYDEDFLPIYQSVTPMGSGAAAAQSAFETEFNALATEGECTFSHFGDYDLSDTVFFPQIRQCKGPNGEMLPPAPGRLLNPVGLAVDGKKVYVSDLFNHRIQVFDFYGNVIPMEFPIGNGVPGNGQYTYDDPDTAQNDYRPYGASAPASWGSSGHQLYAPYGLALDWNPAGRRLLVADTYNHRVALFNNNGSPAFPEVPVVGGEPIHATFEIPAGLTGPPVMPDQVAISPGAVLREPGSDPLPDTDPAADHRIVVTDRGHCYAIIMDTAFNVIKTLPESMPVYSQGYACTHDSVTTKAGEFSTLTAVKIDGQGNIYIADHAQNVVQVLNKGGETIAWIGRPGEQNPGGAGTLNGPVALTIDHFNRLGVVDAGNGRAVFYGLDSNDDQVNTPAAVTFEFQIDSSIAVDDFSMGIDFQRAETSQDLADGLDPKGRILVTDAYRRTVSRFELPELVIVNATASNGVGRFDVAVPKQKAEAVAGVIPTVTALEDGVDIVGLTPSGAIDIGPGQYVQYTFDYTIDENASVTMATFKITAAGAGGVQAPDATALLRLPCTDCGALATIHDFPQTEDTPPVVTPVTTPLNGAWFGNQVFVRLTPTGSETAEAFGWYFGGAAGVFDTDTHEDPLEDGHVDVPVLVAGTTTLTYWPITVSGSAGDPETLTINVDLNGPVSSFVSWTPSTGAEGGRLWHNVDVVGNYTVTDIHSGLAANTPATGSVTFTDEGRGLSDTITMEDFLGHVEVTIVDTSIGNKLINIDKTAPTVTVPAPLVVGVNATDEFGPYYSIPPGAFQATAADPLLGNGSEGSGVASITNPTPAQKFRFGTHSVDFSATDYAGNTSEVTDETRSSITVTQADPTLDYNGDITVVYGETLNLSAQVFPTFATGTVTFTVGGRSAADTTLENGVATATLPLIVNNVGEYTVTVAYSGDAAVNAMQTSATITVTHARVTVVANGKRKTYGVENPDLDATVSGAVVGGDAVNYSLNTSAQLYSGVLAGGYPIAVTLGDNPNYDIGTTGGALMIDPRLATVVARSDSRPYRTANPDLVADVAGTVNGDTINYTLVTTAGLTSSVLPGGYPVTVSLGSNPNYSVTPTNGVLTITPVSATVVVTSTERTYGDPNPTFEATVTGVLEGDSLGHSLTTTAVASSPVIVGGYPITVVPGSNPNYTIVPTAGTLTILRRPATITASSPSKTYGNAEPAIVVTQTGILGSDLAAITLSASRPLGNNVGTYVTTPQATGGNAGSYAFTPTTGLLTINPRPITVQAKALTITLGDPLPDLSLPSAYTITAGSLVGTDFITGAMLVVPGTDVNVAYPITRGSLTTGPIAANYALTFVNGSLTLLPAHVNLAPLANPDTASSVGAAPVTIAVLANDRDPDGGVLELTAVGQPTDGAAVGVVTTSGNLVVFTPAPGFAGTATFTYTVIDNQGGSATGMVTVTITAPSTCTAGGYLTYSQGGWGNNGAPGQFLAAKFAQVYGTGPVVIGGTKTLTFTSSNAIKNFLPSGGTPAALTTSVVNPTGNQGGTFSGQLLALKLAVDFSAAGVTKSGLGQLVMVSGTMAGVSVNEILGIANAVLGGQTSALPSGMSISALSSILESLNMNFHEGTVNKGLLGCPGACAAGTINLTATSSATSGTAGNTRTYVGAGVLVKASAFSRKKSNGTWDTAFLGAFGTAGLGVTDGSEGAGSDDTHKVDNLGDRFNYVVFEFSSPVVVSKAFLSYVGDDSDLSIWIGTRAPSSPALTPQLLSNLLTSLGAPQANAASNGSDRWATFNSGNVSGNVLVIAADVTGSSYNDAFKISKLELKCATANQPPTVTAANQSDDEGDVVSVAITADDPNDDDLEFSATGLPSGLSMNPGTGLITGTLGYSTAGSHNVTVTVEDEAGLTATATFVWTVANKNRAPDAVNDTLSTAKNTPKTISVIANDSDPDGTNLTVTAVTQPPSGRGSVVKYSNGTVKYTPPPNWTGTTSFTYTVSDGSLTDTATVSVTVSRHADSDGCGNDHDHDGDHDRDDDRERDCDRDHRHNNDCDRDRDHDRDCDHDHSRNSRCNDNNGWYRDRDNDDRDDDRDHNHNSNGVCSNSSHYGSWYR